MIREVAGLSRDPVRSRVVRVEKCGSNTRGRAADGIPAPSSIDFDRDVSVRTRQRDVDVPARASRAFSKTLSSTSRSSSLRACAGAGASAPLSDHVTPPIPILSRPTTSRNMAAMSTGSGGGRSDGRASIAAERARDLIELVDLGKNPRRRFPRARGRSRRACRARAGAGAARRVGSASADS